SQLHVAVPLLSGSVELVVAADRIDELRNEAQWQIVIVVVILVVVATLTCWFLARRLAKPLHDAARSLEALSNELVTSAREQEASTGQSATAIGETRRMMETVVNTAQEISTNCAAVLSNAEHTLSGNRAIAERISELSSQSERVAEILAGVMKVADRTDLLALNAGLEGAKAGEAGKGFALVATEMRRLAETTMQSVQNINGLISEVRERAQAATEASSRGMRFSEDTAESARAIARTTQAQRHATEQVGTSMDEMSELLRHNLNNIQTTARTATEVGLVAQSLTQVVDRRTAVQAAASSSPPLNG
nr:methyl-accepting chemotaxis protein [Kofleriaceae bacterium]